MKEDGTRGARYSMCLFRMRREEWSKVVKSENAATL